MLRSLDHVGRVVDRRTGYTRHDVVQSWTAAARGAFLGAYRGGLEAQHRLDLLDERLLRPFEVEQACRELVYAARHLPRWTYVPDAALTDLLPSDGTDR
jgi:maltokinase